MTVTASHLRGNIYRMLDQTIETGRPIEVKRKGRILKIIQENPASKLSRLVKRPCIKGNPEDLVHLDWSEGWKP